MSQYGLFQKAALKIKLLYLNFDIISAYTSV